MPNTTTTVTALRSVPFGVDRVMSIPQWAVLAGISYAHAKKIISDGNGPKLIRISPGRVGVTVSSHHAWLAEKRRLKAKPAADGGDGFQTLEGTPSNTGKVLIEREHESGSGWKLIPRTLTATYSFQPPTQNEVPTVPVPSTGDDSAGFFTLACFRSTKTVLVRANAADGYARNRSK